MKKLEGVPQLPEKLSVENLSEAKPVLDVVTEFLGVNPNLAQSEMGQVFLRLKGL